MQTTIKNNYISLVIQHKGAELSSIKNKENIEFIWQADEKFWPRHAPILFPIVGKLKDSTYSHEGVNYKLPQHGFARDKNFFLKSSSDDFVVFYLNSDSESQHYFPFEFELMVSYGLIKNKVIIDYKVSNFGSSAMPFSIGAHPGFTCPLAKGEQFEDYKLVFDEEETLSCQLLENGLLSGKSEAYLTKSKEIKLTASIFDRDALIFENFKSKFLTLQSTKSDHAVKVSIEGFPYLGIWSKAGAPFVCIEPWFGITDSNAASGVLLEKKGILILEPQKDFSCTYSIEVV